MTYLITHFFDGGTQEQYDAFQQKLFLVLGALENPPPPPEERTAEITNQVNA